MLLPKDMNDQLEDHISDYLLNRVDITWFNKLYDDFGTAPRYASFWLTDSVAHGQMHNNIVDIKELIFPIDDKYKHLTDQLIDINIA